MWLYGSGFPKSLDVSKAIDKAAGAERDVVGYDASRARPNRLYEGGALGNIGGTGKRSDRTDNGATLTAPATDEAQRWAGWGTALKPGHEPIVVARKPLVGTVERNVREHGTGALNIAATRIEYLSEQDRSSAIPQGRATAKVGALAGGVQNARERSEFAADNTKGRWPANVVLDEDAARELDALTGERKSGYMKPGQKRHASRGLGGYGDGFPDEASLNGTYGDSGGASRFYYVSKASRSERNAGLDGMPKSKRSDDGYGSIQKPILDRAAPRENWEPHATANDHPTVKPIELMRWLVRLVCPPGGLVLDPFAGSGTTGCAAALEGFDFIGIEQDGHYADIARRRIAYWAGPLLMEVVA
jgi:hypothetical protein